MGQGMESTFSDKQGQMLLKIARCSIAQKLGISLGDDPVDLNQAFLQKKRGLFVTLHKYGDLRGCIGIIEPDQPLKTGIWETARLAAFKDTRFTPLKDGEFNQIELEISLLSVPQMLAYKRPQDLPTLLTPFQDGVIIEKESARATFLPQVWEQLPDPFSFLSRLSMKAGLDEDEWTKGELTVYTYGVQVFSE